MSLQNIAQHLANQGRGKDTTLVHMTPSEVSGLAALARANGKEISVNPQTGLPEAGALESILAGLALNYIAPGVGGAIGEMFGLSGAAGTGLAVGAGTAAITGNIGKGFEAGFNAYTGAGLGESVAGLGMGELGREASSAAVNSIPFPQEGADAATREAYNKAIQDSVSNRMASATMADKYGAGLNYASNNPMTALKTTGKYLAPAALSIFADKSANDVQTTTPQQKPNPGVYHPFIYDPIAQTMTPGQRYTAANGGLMSLAHGGAVRRFDDGGLTLDQMYKNVLGREADTGGRDFWASQFGDTVDANELATFRQSALGGTDTADKAAAMYAPFGGATQYSDPMANGFGSAAPAAPAAPNFGGQGAIGNNLTNMAPVRDARADEAAFTAAGNAANNAGIAALPNAGAAMGANNANTANYIPISKLDDLYMQELSRHGEYGTDGKEGGMEFWKRTFGDYIDPQELAGFRAEAAKELAARKKAELPAVVTDLTTADTTYVKPGVGGSTGAGQIGGGTVVNPNGTITTSPVIPGIPVGGFTGMEQVRDTYTKGGGKLGYVPYAPKTIAEFNEKYKNTGDSKAMYDYLMGKGPYPTTTGTADVDAAGKKVYREPSKVYSEVMGGPVNPNKQYIWNKTSGKYDTNPDYVRQEKVTDPVTGNRVIQNYMSINNTKSSLDEESPMDIKELTSWAKRNFVDDKTLATVMGITPFQLQKMQFEADKAGAKLDKKKWVKAAGGGLMSLANGGAVRYGTGGPTEGKATEYIDPTTGDKYILDTRYGGGYRKETVVENGITYKWNPVTNKYETGAASGTGIASLIDNGPPAGGENPAVTTPDWNAAATIGKTLSDLGLTTIGNYLSQAAREGRTAQQLDPTDIQDSSRDDTRGPMRGKSGNADTDIGPEVFDFTGPDVNPEGISEADAAFNGRPGGGGVPQGDPNAPDPFAGTAPGWGGSDNGSNDSGNYGGNGSGYMAKGGYIGHYAQGGLGSLGGYSDGGRLLRGPGDGVSDSIPATIGASKQPARLANNEFVIPARIVSELGNGSTDAGAKQLYAMMARIQAGRKKTTGKNSIAVDSKAYKHLPA